MTQHVDKQFVSSVSPGAARAGAGGYPCQGDLLHARRRPARASR